MARTSKSRGGSGFTMRSGNSTSFKSMGSETPYPFLKGLAGGIFGGVKGIIENIRKNKASKAADATTAEVGNIGGGTGGSDEKLKLIGEIITSDEGGEGTGTLRDVAVGTALTKKSPSTK